MVKSPRQHAHQFDVSFCVQHEVLRLQVSVEDSFAMEVIESFRDATDAESGGGVVKASPADDSSHYIDPPEPTDRQSLHSLDGNRTMIPLLYVMMAPEASVSGWSLLPVSEQTPNLSTQTGLQQHVHILIIPERTIQSGERQASFDLHVNRTLSMILYYLFLNSVFNFQAVVKT